jgi:hypothetical protein
MFTSIKRELLQFLAHIVASEIIRHLLDYGVDQWPPF